MIIKKSLIQTFPLAIVLSGLFAYSFIDAWTNPIPPPPTNNTIAPVDVSAITQDKAGLLGVGSLTVFGNTNLIYDNPKIIFDDTVTGRKFRIMSIDQEFQVGVDRNNDNIFDSTDFPVPIIMGATSNSANDYFKVANAVHANEYCNRSGGSCFTASQVGLGGLSTYSQKTNPRGVSYSGNPVCSCKAGDWLTGCSGPQTTNYDTSAIIGAQACYGEADTPVCTCLTSN